MPLLGDLSEYKNVNFSVFTFLPTDALMIGIASALQLGNSNGIESLS